MYSKFMRGSPLLEGQSTTPGAHLSEKEKKIFNQVLDACKKYGLDFYPTIIQKTRYDEMSEIAAYGGFPHRYPHWSFGMSYEELQRGYEHNQQRIYEMVINCCKSGTRVPTIDGTKFIEDIDVGDIVIARGGNRKVIYTKKQPKSNLLSIKFDDFKNDIICTPNHKWRVLGLDGECWVETKNIKKGDILLAGGKFENFLKNQPNIKWNKDEVWNNTLLNVRWCLKDINPVKKLTLELAEFLGICVGDGSQGVPGQENAIAITIDKTFIDYKQHVHDLLKSIFGVEIAIYEKPSATIIQINSKYAVDYLDNLGLRKGVTHEYKVVPNIIWESSNEYRSAFLRGLFDTDGHVKKSLNMSSTSEKLVKEVQILLLEMGIRSKISHVNNKNNDIWVLSIKGRANQFLFKKYINFSLDYKKDGLERLVGSGYAISHGYKIPYLQNLIIKEIDELPTQRKLPAWVKRFKWIYGKKQKECPLNAMWSFVNRIIIYGFNNFKYLLDILETPMYQVMSIDEESSDISYDIALDHNDHDFIANGFVTHNTSPTVIYILSSNTMVDDVCVVAHATGHNDFFKNNIFFGATDTNMLNRMANNGARVRKYMAKWGREKVTEFIDHVLRIQTLINPTNAWNVKEIKEPVLTDQREYHYPRRLKTDNLHMDPWINPKSYIDEEYKKIEEQEMSEELELFEGQDKDIFAFIKDHGYFKPWQADIIAMLYEEAMYFSPQRATKTLNEGWACIRNAYVPTSYGILHIEDIVNNKLNCKTSHGEVTNWFSFEDRDTFKVITKRGFEIEGSDTHRILDFNGNWKRMDSIKVGDVITLHQGKNCWSNCLFEIDWKPTQRMSIADVANAAKVSKFTVNQYRLGKRIRKFEEVKLHMDAYESQVAELGLIQPSRRKKISLPKFIDEDFARFLGYMIGDGHISDVKRELGLTSGDKSQIDKYAEILKDKFGLDCNIKWDDTSKNGRWRVRAHSLNLRDLLVSLGLPTGISARIKKIPDCILRSPKNIVAAFLSAYFDSDGGGYEENGIILSTSSPEMAKQIQVVLLNFGIISSKYLKDKGNYHIFIGGKSVMTFYKEIGFRLERKQNEIKNFIFDRQWFQKQEFIDEIKSVEFLGKQTVYDITVENTHRYSAQGFINHNSFIDYEILAREGLVSLGQDSHDVGIVEYAAHKTGVLGGKYSMNPYKIGFYLLLDVEERWNKGQFGPEWDECKDIQKKENWDLKLGKGKDKIFEVRKYYNDLTFINEFFTQDFCDRFEFFDWKHYPNGEWKIESRDHKVIKKKLLNKYANGGLPDIRLIDPNHRNKGYMLLQHFNNEGDDRVLYEKYARATLTSLYYFWKKEVMLITENKDKEELIYVCEGTDPDKDVAIVSREDYERTW